MQLLLMHNPSAGDEEHDAEHLVALLQAAGHEVSWHSTKSRDWKDALAEPVDLVVAAGGDGTIRKVFPQLLGRQVPATLFPVGSANNIARSLGFEDDDPARLIRGWPRARRRPFDVGALNVDGRMFLESVGGGLFADLLLTADRSDHEPSGDDKIEHGRRLLLSSLPEAQAHPWEVELDGVDGSGELLAFEVMNIREAGPNIPIAPEASPSDGLLDGVLIRPVDAPILAAYLEELVDGGSPEPPRLDVRRARRIVFKPPSGAALRVDDELLAEQAEGRTATRIAAEPAAAIEVLVP